MKTFMNGAAARFFFPVGLILAAGFSGVADDGGLFWGWNISAGGNMGFGLKTDLRSSPRNAIYAMPALHPQTDSTSQNAAETVRKALRDGRRVAFSEDKSAFMDPESTWGETHPDETQNWRFPDSAADAATESFRFRKAYIQENDGTWSEVGGTWSRIVGGADTVQSGAVSGKDSDVAWGASVDLSHLLYASADGTWGVDVAFGLTWMMARHCFKNAGTGVVRSADVESGESGISITGADFLNWWEPEDGGWGAGTADGSASSPYTDFALNMNDIVNTQLSGASGITSYRDALALSSTGDYQEWELSFLLKPWYEINEWMCVHGALGIGVTRSSFDYSIEAMYNGMSIYRSSQEFHEWRCYGIAGGGMLFRVWDFDISCDAFFRWCQQDMRIDGNDVNGTLEKPWGVLRIGLSYAF